MTFGSAIQELPVLLGPIFEELSALTGGWHYTVLMGGADPLCEGDIMTLRCVVLSMTAPPVN